MYYIIIIYIDFVLLLYYILFMEDNTMKNYYGICEWSMPVSGPLAIRLAGTAGFDGMQLVKPAAEASISR